LPHLLHIDYSEGAPTIVEGPEERINVVLIMKKCVLNLLGGKLLCDLLFRKPSCYGIDKFLKNIIRQAIVACVAIFPFWNRSMPTRSHLVALAGSANWLLLHVYWGDV
jgi:hypothetical protein